MRGNAAAAAAAAVLRHHHNAMSRACLPAPQQAPWHSTHWL